LRDALVCSVLRMPDRITGTLVWYAMICEREVWLMAHELEPDRDDARLEWGRFLGQMSYPRSRKREINLPGMKLDIVESHGARIVVGEIKSSSRFVEATRMQMLFYPAALADPVSVRSAIRRGHSNADVILPVASA